MHPKQYNTRIIFIHTIIFILNTKYLNKNLYDQFVFTIHLCHFIQLMKDVVSFLCVILIKIHFILILHFYSFMFTIKIILFIEF